MKLEAPFSGEPLKDYLIRVVPHVSGCGLTQRKARCVCPMPTHRRRLAAVHKWHEANPKAER
jgi:hypothetical protein